MKLESLCSLSRKASIPVGIFILLIGYFIAYPSYLFHSIALIAVVASCTLIAIPFTLENNRKKSMDENLPRLLDDLADCQEAGMTLLQSLVEASQRRYGPLTRELKKLVAEISFGVRFEEAFTSFSKRIGTESAERITALLLEAIRTGGDLRRILRDTATFFRRMYELNREKEATLRPYFMVVYATVIIFIVVMILLYHGLFIPLAKLQIGFLKMPFSIEEYRAMIFDVAAIIAFFGGLTAGKMAEGKILAGLKHSIVLLIITLIAFHFWF